VIACPSCHKEHPNHLTARNCSQCSASFDELYMCPERTCQMHHQLQPRSRQCVVCQRILVGQFSGREIQWGHAVYRIREYLGGGGMGEVYRAVEQDQVGTYAREVAVKFNKNMMDVDIVKRFQLEIQILSMLQNPHNIRVYTYGELFEERSTGMEVSAQFMVMELLKGEPLNEVIKRGAIPPEDAVGIFIEVCGALSEAHQKGIIHRDLKPHNIMLQDVSGDRFAKVFDFGLSRLTHSMDARISTSGVVMGTFRYMSPEQALGEDLDHRTDIFSIGVVMYELLAGKHPFPAKNLFELFMLHQEGAPPIGTIPPELEEIVMKTVAYEKDHRYQSVDDLRADLIMFRGDSLSGRLQVGTGSYARSAPPQPEGNVMVRPPLSMEQALALQNEIDANIPLDQTSDNPSEAHVVSAAQFKHLDHNKLSETGKQVPTPPAQPTSGSGKMGIAIVASLFVMVLGLAGVYFMRKSKVAETPKIGGLSGMQNPIRRRALRAAPIKKRVEPAIRRKVVRAQPIKSRKRSYANKVRSRRRYRRRKRRRRGRYVAMLRRRKAPARVEPAFRREVVEPRVIPRERPIERRVIERPRIIPPRPRERKIIPRKVIKRAPPPCPGKSGYVTYSQLDRVLGKSITTRVIRKINRAARSHVYDAGLTLSKSWKRSPVLCKASYLRRYVKGLVQRFCGNYRPYSHCRGYKAAMVSSGSKARYVCKR